MTSLSAGRAAAERRMTETVRAGVIVDGVDPATLDATRTIQTPYTYEGKAQVSYLPETTPSTSSGTGQVVAEQRLVVKTPVGVVIPDGEGVEVTASESDASLVGRMYRVQGSPTLGQVTSHRHPVVELS